MKVFEFKNGLIFQYFFVKIEILRQFWIKKELIATWAHGPTWNAKLEWDIGPAWHR